MLVPLSPAFSNENHSEIDGSDEVISQWSLALFDGKQNHFGRKTNGEETQAEKERRARDMNFNRNDPNVPQMEKHCFPFNTNTERWCLRCAVIETFGRETSRAEPQRDETNVNK